MLKFMLKLLVFLLVLLGPVFSYFVAIRWNYFGLTRVGLDEFFAAWFIPSFVCWVGAYLVNTVASQID